MSSDTILAMKSLMTPRAAVIASILFAVLLITSLGLALFLLLSTGLFYWTPRVFPLGVLLISVCILVSNLGKPKRELMTATQP